MRVIADSTGVEWTVFEVKKQSTPADRWSHLPEEFANGWLCFESDYSKRRLTPVPARWVEFSDDQLNRLLSDAHPVSRLRFGVSRTSQSAGTAHEERGRHR